MYYVNMERLIYYLYNAFCIFWLSSLTIITKFSNTALGNIVISTNKKDESHTF